MSSISNKELNYIKDFLSWELLMAKKCFEYSNEVQIQEIKGLFDQAGKVHQQNYQVILNYLGQVNQGVNS